jgi:hypothetical protein
MPDRTFLERPPNDPKIEGISWMNWFKELHRKHEGGWKDEKSDVIVRGNGANDPTWTNIAGDHYAYAFPDGATPKQFWTNQHINHDWSFGTPWYVHLHWLPSNTNTGVCVWQLKVAAAKGHSQQAYNFAAPRTYYLAQAGSGTTHMHQIVEMNDTQATDLLNTGWLEVDTVLMIHIQRAPGFLGGTDSAGIVAPADNYAGTAYATFADAHYQASRFATYNKAPDFYRKT